VCLAVVGPGLGLLSALCAYTPGHRDACCVAAYRQKNRLAVWRGCSSLHISKHRSIAYDRLQVVLQLQRSFLTLLFADSLLTIACSSRVWISAAAVSGGGHRHVFIFNMLLLPYTIICCAAVYTSAGRHLVCWTVVAVACISDGVGLTCTSCT
jgi:hypothetical protein